MHAADDAARQQQGHADEQAAEHVEPIRRQRRRGEIGLCVIDQNRAERRAGEGAAAADRHPDHGFDRIARRELARIDDADLRHVERAGNTGHTGRQCEHEQLVGFDTIAEKARARLGVADRDQHLAEPRGDDGTADHKAEDHREARDREQGGARGLGLDVEADYVLEIGKSVIAAEAEIVAEKAEHQRVGQRLRDDRQIDPGDAAAKGKPAEHEGEQAGHQHHHQRRIGEVPEPVPVDRQLVPIQKHHEVGQDRIGVDAARADLAHQVHAHGVAAEREEGAVAQRQDAAKAPDQVDRQRQQRIAGVFAEQRHEICRHVQGRGRRHREIEHRHGDGDRRRHGDEEHGAAVERADQHVRRRRHHASTARPERANRPRGRF